jgi:TetR/AcrR family transcriptional regulator, repressor for neighboring sulfatase
MARQRIRRSSDEAKRLILEAAEDLLVGGGPSAVQVRTVAQRVGMTDAGVYHHFGTRHDLLVALLRQGGRRLRQAVEQAVDDWTRGEPDLELLVAAIAALYRDGYAELAIALHAAGWRDPAGGLLEPVVEALHSARMRAGRRGTIEDTRLAVAAMHLALALDPIYGGAFRRSAGIDRQAARDPEPQLAWWSATLTGVLGLSTGRR